MYIICMFDNDIWFELGEREYCSTLPSSSGGTFDLKINYNGGVPRV